MLVYTYKSYNAQYLWKKCWLFRIETTLDPEKLHQDCPKHSTNIVVPRHTPPLSVVSCVVKCRNQAHRLTEETSGRRNAFADINPRVETTPIRWRLLSVPHLSYLLSRLARRVDERGVGDVPGLGQGRPDRFRPVLVEPPTILLFMFALFGDVPRAVSGQSFSPGQYQAFQRHFLLRFGYVVVFYVVLFLNFKDCFSFTVLMKEIFMCKYNIQRYSMSKRKETRHVKSKRPRVCGARAEHLRSGRQCECFIWFTQYYWLSRIKSISSIIGILIYATPLPLVLLTDFCCAIDLVA